MSQNSLSVIDHVYLWMSSFNTFYSIFWDSVVEILSSMIASELMSDILSNLRSLVELYFSCFAANKWLDLWETANGRGSNIVMTDKAISTSKAQPLVNVGIGYQLQL